MSFMGVDVGTTGCKAVVFDDDGRQIASACRDYPLHHSQPGWAELDSAQVIALTLASIREAAGRCAHDKVRSIGFCSQGEAFTPVDHSGRPLGNAMISFDNRAAAIAESFSESFGRRHLYEITGHTPHPMFSLFKLLWLKNHHPDVWKNARYFLCFEDLMQRQLRVGPAIGWSLAARTMLFDVTRHQWSDAILDAGEIEAHRLARTMPSGSIVDRLPDEVVEDLQLARGAVIITAGHDQPCGALGGGAIVSGCAVYGNGTFDCITPAFDRPIFTDALQRANLCTYDHAFPGLYTTVAFSLTGGNILTWFRDQWGQREVDEARHTGVSAYELLLNQLNEAPSDLLVLPHFTATGTPSFDPTARGAILGLQLTTTRREMLKALLEGVAMEMRLNVQILEGAGVAVDQLRAIGGGARNQTWMQLKADVLGKPISIVNVTEAGCLAAAMLGCAALTGAPLRDLVERWVRVTSSLEPRRQHTRVYDQRFATYSRLYAALKPLQPG